MRLALKCTDTTAARPIKNVVGLKWGRLTNEPKIKGSALAEMNGSLNALMRFMAKDFICLPLFPFYLRYFIFITRQAL